MLIFLFRRNPSFQATQRYPRKSSGERRPRQRSPGPRAAAQPQVRPSSSGQETVPNREARNPFFSAGFGDIHFFSGIGVEFVDLQQISGNSRNYDNTLSKSSRKEPMVDDGSENLALFSSSAKIQQNYTF